MITLTESAISAVSRFIQGSEDPVAGLRVSVSGGGCSGLQYGLKLEAEAAAEDNIIECGPVKILVHPEMASLLEGVEVDFVDSIEGSGFKFTNPNATASCACGQSFAC
ncbi:MAG: HesB/IscA family protein [Gammaproteobacteria bacterium]